MYALTPSQNQRGIQSPWSLWNDIRINIQRSQNTIKIILLTRNHHSVVKLETD
jgi:hypothetical protein